MQKTILNVPNQWVALNSLSMPIQAGVTYYFKNISEFPLYYVESNEVPTFTSEDPEVKRLLPNKCAGYVESDKTLYVSNLLPIEYPLPEFTGLALCPEMPEEAIAVVGDYNPSETKGAYVFKGSVANAEALPKEGIEVGDVYNLEDTGMNVAWTGSEWDSLGGTVSIDLTPYAKTVDVEAALELKADKAEIADVVNYKSFETIARLCPAPLVSTPEILS